MGLGKEQGNDFGAQAFSSTASFLRYNLLNFLNEQENFSTTGTLFEHLVDESATDAYAKRIWDFFCGHFRVRFSAIFNHFKIENECPSYINALS